MQRNAQLCTSINSIFDFRCFRLLALHFLAMFRISSDCDKSHSADAEKLEVLHLVWLQVSFRLLMANQVAALCECVPATSFWAFELFGYDIVRWIVPDLMFDQTRFVLKRFATEALESLLDFQYGRW